MHSYFKFSVLAVLIFFAGISLQAQQLQMPQASPSAKIAQQVGLTQVTVDYSRPSTKGRKSSASSCLTVKYGGPVPTELPFSTSLLKS